MTDAPLVTVLIPARNEEADIKRCLRAVLDQDHPHGRMEIVLVDGGSTDATAEVARRLLGAGDVTWRVMGNPIGTTPSSLNIGLADATGKILCRVDARTIIPQDYVRRCAAILAERPDVVVTGGAQVAVALDRSPRAVGIARALNNRYGMGLSRYRRRSGSGESDTVYLGAFRTGELREVGGWDERLPTNQDFDLNRRMARHGAVWFEQSLTCGYVPRRSVPELWRQYVRFGRWKVRYWRLTADRPQTRQLVLAGVPVAGGALALLWLSRRPGAPRIAVLAAAGASGLGALEVVGADEPRGDVLAHCYAAAAMVVVGGGWLSGLWGEILATAPAVAGPGGGTGQPAIGEQGRTVAER